MIETLSHENILLATNSLKSDPIKENIGTSNHKMSSEVAEDPVERRIASGFMMRSYNMSQKNGFGFGWALPVDSPNIGKAIFPFGSLSSTTLAIRILTRSLSTTSPCST
jgi:hypothetical protein